MLGDSEETESEGLQTAAIDPVVPTRDARGLRLVVSGAQAGQTRPVDRLNVRIGKAEDNDLILDDPTVSRYHCVISMTPHGLLLRDDGSRNGTWVGGTRVQSAYLEPGVVVGLGGTTVTLQRAVSDSDPLRRREDRLFVLLGRSPAMQSIVANLGRIAASDSTVLLEGETGTGKTHLAQLIHGESPRAAAPFVVVDCSAIPAALIESELFGYTKGAFTGATVSRAGAFQAASGGTIFLDEIGELPLDMQPKLLRALEERVVKPLGSQENVHVDVRIIAATNRQLDEAVRRGVFRADLFYRLNTVAFTVPPLRSRREDIPFLVTHFQAQLAERGTRGQLPPALIESFTREAWPGNVRELRNAVERAILLGSAAIGQPSALAPTPMLVPVAPTFDPALSFREAKERAVGGWERTYFQELLRFCGGNLSRAARQVQMDRNHLRDLLRRHGLRVE